MDETARIAAEKALDEFLANHFQELEWNENTVISKEEKELRDLEKQEKEAEQAGIELEKERKRIEEKYFDKDFVGKPGGTAKIPKGIIDLFKDHPFPYAFCPCCCSYSEGKLQVAFPFGGYFVADYDSEKGLSDNAKLKFEHYYPSDVSIECRTEDCYAFWHLHKGKWEGPSLEDGSAKPGPGRNDLCPCGSGKKYKYCCRR